MTDLKSLRISEALQYMQEHGVGWSEACSAVDWAWGGQAPQPQPAQSKPAQEAEPDRRVIGKAPLTESQSDACFQYMRQHSCTWDAAERAVVGSRPLLYEAVEQPVAAPQGRRMSESECEEAVAYMREHPGCIWDDVALQYSKDLTSEEERRVKERMRATGCSWDAAVRQFRGCQSHYLTPKELEATFQHMKERSVSWEKAFRDFFDGKVAGYTHEFRHVPPGSRSGTVTHLPLGQ
jgi:hypothetical protein